MSASRSVCVVGNALRLRTWKPSERRQHEATPAAAPAVTVTETEAEAGTEAAKATERRTTMEKKLNVEGMMCQHCVAHVKGALEGVDGVTEAVVDLEAGTAVAKCAARRRGRGPCGRRQAGRLRGQHRLVPGHRRLIPVGPARGKRFSPVPYLCAASRSLGPFP